MNRDRALSEVWNVLISDRRRLSTVEIKMLRTITYFIVVIRHKFSRHGCSLSLDGFRAYQSEQLEFQLTPLTSYVTSSWQQTKHYLCRPNTVIKSNNKMIDDQAVLPRCYLGRCFVIGAIVDGSGVWISPKIGPLPSEWKYLLLCICYLRNACPVRDLGGDIFVWN